MKNKYIAIDLKSFYASVECVERGLDPLFANLVVADSERTEKTICLAASPAIKSFGIPSRSRLFQVIETVKLENAKRRRLSPTGRLYGSSIYADELKLDPTLAIDYIVARPRMGLYIDYSVRIYKIYLEFFSPDDIHVYSIDEVFIDVSKYSMIYKMSVQELCARVVSRILSETGITATVGIGENLYLAKVAMDIVAKRMPPDEKGTRIAVLDEMSYREKLWSHKPITDFWRVGRGYAKKLASMGAFTMGDVAALSLRNDELLYRAFGVNAELLIDHAWGYESCTMEDIKSYRPSSKSLSSGQVLDRAYSIKEAETVLIEMCDELLLSMAKKKVSAGAVSIYIGYDSSFTAENESGIYHSKGTVSFKPPTSLPSIIVQRVVDLYRSSTVEGLKVRRINVTASSLCDESIALDVGEIRQLDIFTDPELQNHRDAVYMEAYEKEMDRQRAIISIKEKYGKNAIIKGNSLQKEATATRRNEQIGGHRK